MALAEEEAVEDWMENTAGTGRRSHVGASDDTAEEETLVPSLDLLCLSSAASPSPFSSRGISIFGSWCPA